ncbi:aminotransferase class I/II-fold pyridoxal phosphate-dependent enzyme [Janthinobacterium agaricidamnosum]|uniref:Putative 8-amino-7-oxononanoate synthase n=1 Tax=Janthinobacterium agaricidamnosum NBRC 102515 = DSM 9628 TaxID=1349767 RepID=W0V4P3_9BURK|nr:aminotransferase class I/II-fold pyridoxal phosphate-dependent enzyme [Janthinobacterium agaricidamnosum]CDG82846.1 putative 8-amino-7-oxononanoate synthase [Janthinobacterium agaricidamnosum NBRC 102515 = DSM 9628]
MADFTSALYLGMRHPSSALAGWDALTPGRPAALREASGARRLARELAALQGCEAATLLPSTLHLFWDVFGMLARERLVLLIDGGAYPVARWGAERAAALGAPLQVFAHGDAAAAADLARRWLLRGRRPLILADGVCPASGKAPPLAAYAHIAGAGGGYLVLDDTQVLGLSGPRGGGSMARHGWSGDGVLVGASLAKAFGAPLAVLSGSAAMVARFEAHSQTRIHNSPPSCAALAAGQRALRLNRSHGAVLRQLLRQRIAWWRGALAAAGIACRGGAFPVQSVVLAAHIDGAALQGALRGDGIDAVLSGRHRLTFLLRADHRPGELRAAATALRHHLLEVL